MNNYELANEEACKYDGVLLRDCEEGEFWHCVGLLIAADDIYYEVIRQSDRKRMLLSFVGDLESHGFAPVVNEQEKAMTQPTEQQLNDPKWWDANTSPDTVQVALIEDARGGVNGVFHLMDYQSWPMIVPNHPDHELKTYNRPARPAAPEWNGEGLPPAGARANK